MLSVYTSREVQQTLARDLKKRRRARRHSRAVASEQSGVPTPTLRRFETTGEISLRQFLMLVEVYGDLSTAIALLKPPPATSMDELVAMSREDI